MGLIFGAIRLGSMAARSSARNKQAVPDPPAPASVKSKPTLAQQQAAHAYLRARAEIRAQQHRR